MAYNKIEKAYYWNEKEKRALKARNHTLKNEKENRIYTEKSIESSVILDDGAKTEIKKGEKETIIEVIDTDTVSAIFKLNKEIKETNNKEIAALNFASFKYPGGGFLSGSQAQEECLCHESNLYNVLSDKRFENYYEWNNKHLNNSLYLNRAIYSPSVRFERNCEVAFADILTCAAPNFTSAEKFNHISSKTNEEFLFSRCYFVLKCLAEQKPQYIILGAFGCGVFGQEPKAVARIFKELLENDFSGIFEIVLFAIPLNSRNNNFQIFESVFNGRGI